MKSLSKFIIETQSGGSKSNSGTDTPDPWFPEKKKKSSSQNSANKKKTDALKNEVSKRTQQQRRQQQIINQQYGTDGGYGDSNTGYQGAGSEPNNSSVDKKKTEPKVEPKKKSSSTPKKVSSVQRKMLQRTNRQTGGKVSVNYSEPTRPTLGDKLRDIEGDPQSGKVKAEVEKLTNQKTREFTQKGGVTKGNESKYVNKTKDGADKLLDKILNPKTKITSKIGEKELDKAVLERPSNKPPVNPRTGSRIPDPKKGELGKLYKTSTKTDSKRGGSVRTTDKINQELTAKRAARINPKTGKATRKGVENFAINQQTKGFSTKGDAGKQAIANAKKIANNARSAAYKDIANKINTSDYAGKRAKLASTKELDKIAKDLKTSPTISGKAPASISKSLSPSKFSISGTRTGKVTPFTKTSGIKYNTSKPPVSASSKKSFSQFRSKSNIAKLKLPKGSLLGTPFVALDAVGNYKAAKGSPLRKFAKSALTTAAYYKGGAAGGAVGTGFGAITGPGAFVTGTAGFIAGGQTASNLTSKAFDKIWKPPTTKTKTKTINPRVGGIGGNKGNKGFTWKSGIAIESGKK